MSTKLNQSHGSGKSIINYDERVLQYIGPGRSGEAEIVVGLDFGTSASKVVVRLPGVPGDPAYAVNFGEFAHPSMCHLLPTRLWITNGDECSLTQRPQAQLVNDIKLELFSTGEDLKSTLGPSGQDISPESAAVAYLALVLRYVRKWLLIEKRDTIGHFEKFNWNVNLGIPSSCARENEENNRFRRVGKAAWILSVLGEKVTLSNAKAQLETIIKSPERWDTDKEKFTCEFEIIPEIAAGAIGYARSTVKKDGLHLIIDVGASTVDVCSFNLYSGNYGLLTTEVQQLGTISLHQVKIRAIQKAHELKAKALRDEHDPISPIAEGIEPYLLTREQILSAVGMAQGELERKCIAMLWTAISFLRKDRHPNSPVWNGRLPIICIGGGSRLEFYKSLIKKLNNYLIEHVKNDGLEKLDVTVPIEFGTQESEHHRFAVAWGLSHEAVNIGDIIPVDQIPDIERPPPLDWERGFIDKNQV